jgi:hypothetical protein
MCDVVSKDPIRYVKCLLNKLGPTVIAILGVSNDAGHHPSYNLAIRIIDAMTPGNQRVPQFNGFQNCIPVFMGKVVKDLRSSKVSECRMSCIEAGDEPIVSSGFGDQSG